ncbi:MAG TPA: amidohydrolase family protein [Thermoanaerobaculia bacterium]
MATRPFGSPRLSFFALGAAVAALFAIPIRGGPGDIRGGDRLAYALTGARVIAAPGKVVDPGTVVIRGGVITAVGPSASTAIPADARVFEAKGKTIHAAFLDPYVTADRLAGKRPPGPRDDEEDSSASDAGRGGPPAPGRASERVIEGLVVKDRVADTYRRLGFAVVAAVPSAGILRGAGAVVGLGDADTRVLIERFGQYVSLEPPRLTDFSAALRRSVYPAARMGAVAFVRQSFLDALWLRDAEAAYAQSPNQPRPAWDAAAAALLPAATGKEPVVFEATDVLSFLRAGRIAREMKLQPMYVGAGDEYRLLPQVATLKPELILRVDFPKPRRLENEDEWLDVTLPELRRIDRAPSNPKWLRDAGLAFSLTTHGLEDPDDFPKRVREAMARGLSADDALSAVTTHPARQLGLGARLGTIEAGKIADLAVETGEPFSEGSRVSEIWIDGRRFELPMPAGKPAPAAEKTAPAPTPDLRPLPSRDDLALAEPSAVVVRHATIWTEGPAGTLDDADLVVSGGKIVAVGKNLAAPAGALEIDGRGKQVSPGVIDAHSHTAIDDSSNEFTHNVTAEVRIRDVLDPFDVAIYRELAGGTTVANVLHGSANAIGGQSQVVKWRRGGGPDDLLFVGAPEVIKFALGENPKQANFQNPHPRYPATRMGVANLIRERFLAARDYKRRLDEYAKAAAVKGAHPIPVRRDLQLDALVEVLEGKRQIHCHSYRKDEILQMIRTADEFGIKVAAFQHVLEGYKVADELAKHGAGASTFSDWWAYKFEVYDAIPYNGALMRERGVVVSFNSDSDELARRLNGEAAKAVRYGGVPPIDALAFVTINPAKQLGVDKRVGSLEPGKDGDFVIWSGDPLSAETVALETWIEGKKYFDRAADLARRPALDKERADLVAKAKALLPPASSGEKDKNKMRAEPAPTAIPHLTPPGPTPTPEPRRTARRAA